MTNMPTKNYLAVDLGATSGRTIIATYDGHKVEMQELTRSRTRRFRSAAIFSGISPTFITKS